jgi:hypothetical protein
LTTSVVGSPEALLPPVDPHGVHHENLLEIAGSNWGSAPNWKQLLARVSLMLADENQMDVLNAIA